MGSAVTSSWWPRLDAFEGEGYERVLVTVTLCEGQDVEAYVYALRRDI
ncbi:MAG: gamma-glutamylcyclotransferase [Thermoanaerobaculia bacterium]|nr:gamma-glutamylcyclotransferase [Thermoanaerobaculia bacterium]